MFNKKIRRGQIAETMTWMVATIIIIIILLVSILLLTGRDSVINRSKSIPYTNKVDLFVTKSLTAYLLTKDAKGTIYNEINTDGQLNDFNGNLAKQIFMGLYGGFYTRQIYFSIAENKFFCTTTIAGNPLGTLLCPVANNYFSFSGSIAGESAEKNAVVYALNLAPTNKFVQLVLWH